MAGLGRTLLAAAAMLQLAACDNGPSAVARDEPRPSSTAESSPPSGGSDRRDVAQTSDKQIDGKPMWSASRRYTAEENAQRAFDRNGEAFGARNVDEFVKKAHAFVSDPPRGALTLTRANGDTLIYDPKGNVFAVATRDGAPRTMFKPDDGAAYWEEQKAREERRRTARSREDGDGEG